MRYRSLPLFIIAFFLITASTFANPSADLIYGDSNINVSIDTSSLSGTDGYLYFQYIPVNAADSSATITNFDTTGLSLAASRASEFDGSAVTGLLPGDVVFFNTNAVNDYNQFITFGDSLYFDVLFDLLALDGEEGGGSTFSLGLYADEFGAEPLLSGLQFAADWKNDGTVVTPEAGTLWLIGPALLGLFGMRRKISK